MAHIAAINFITLILYLYAMTISKEFLHFSSLLFEDVEPISDPNPIPVETIAEVTIPYESDLSIDDQKFISDFLGVAYDQPTLKANDNEHNYSRINSNLSIDAETADVGILVNTLASIVQDKKFIDFITKDDDLKAFTNFPTLDQFEKFATLLESALIKVNYKVNFRLDFRKILFLCLVKLKLNLSFTCLAVMFQISRTTAVAYFNFMIDLLQQSLPVP